MIYFKEKKKKKKKIKAEKEANEKEEKKEHALMPRTEKQALTTSVSAWSRPVLTERQGYI